MPYNSNVPQATDVLSQSQLDLLNNFQAIFTLVGVNHSNFGTPNQGKHNFVSMPVQSGNPGTTASEMALYTKTSSLTSVPEAFFQRADGSVVEFTSAAQSVTGWTRLPSNILIKWGQSSGTGSVAVNLSFAGAPVSSNSFIALVSPFSNGAVSDPNVMATVIGLTTTQLTVWTGPRVTTGSSAVVFNWIVIGN